MAALLDWAAAVTILMAAVSTHIVTACTVTAWAEALILLAEQVTTPTAATWAADGAAASTLTAMVADNQHFRRPLLNQHFHRPLLNQHFHRQLLNQHFHRPLKRRAKALMRQE